MVARIALALAALAACTMAVRGPATRPYAIEIRGFTYQPGNATVSVGDTVEWLNRDDFPHTTTADSGAWSSPELKPGDQFVLVPRLTGRFPYHCNAHPSMHGVLVVND